MLNKAYTVDIKQHMFFLGGSLMPLPYSTQFAVERGGEGGAWLKTAHVLPDAGGVRQRVSMRGTTLYTICRFCRGEVHSTPCQIDP